MAGTGKLTDVELLNLIQHISERSLKQSADPDEQKKDKSVENVTVDQTVVEDTRLASVEKLEAEDKLKLLTSSEREHDARQLSQSQSVQTAELVPESPSNVIKVADQQVDFDIRCISLGTQSGCQKLTSTVEQSFKTATEDLQSNVYFPVKKMSGPGVKSPQARSQSSETSPVKEVSQSDVISLHKTESQTNLSSLVEVESNTSVTYTDKQITDSETLPPDTSVSLVDVKSPSYKIDAELVGLLSTEEITNLVHEYRTELESTKKKLDRSERQLAKANDYNNVLRNMVEQLSSDIHRMKHMKTCSVHVQVDKEDFLEYTTGRSSMPNWQAEDDHSTVPMDISHAEETGGLSDSKAQQQPLETDTGTLSIADSVKQAAEAVVQKQQADMLHDSGYVYDEHSGLYYHPASGYYYDQQKSLFYDPKTGTYYYYDYDQGEYMFHSQVELPSQAQVADQSSVKVDLSFKKKYSDAKKSLRTPKTNRSRERHSCDERIIIKDEEMMGEIMSHLEDLKISPHARNARKHALEVAVNYPPCIRVMVMESECLAVGSLFIVTCTGAKIGRENCDICIPDINVSKLHAEICYNETSQQYEIYDHASQNGTFLNNRRLSAAKKASDPAFISHNDCVYISSTKLLCHIHPGSDTCDHCEPGVVMATHKAQQSQTELKVLSKEERLRQKKQELNQIKKKYGLKNSAYENNPEVFNNPNYTDKAEERRKHVGSDVPGQKSEAPASVHRPISTGNVGHKLLQKMGWKEGDSLGKNNTGIQEPVTVTLRASQKAGLGSAGAAGFSADIANNADMKKATRRIQAQQRYKQIETGNQKSSASVAGKVWTKGTTEFT